MYEVLIWQDTRVFKDRKRTKAGLHFPGHVTVLFFYRKEYYFEL